jgi:hypothetical protein
MGRKYKSTNFFSPNDSNTICDTTGFKVKKSQVLRRWEGFYVIPEAFHPRQHQDFPVVPVTQQVYKDVRTESLDTDDALGFDIV